MNKLAIAFLNLGPLETSVVVLLVALLGVAALTFGNFPERRLSRVPYLVFLFAIALGLISSKSLWYELPYAIADGTIWVSLVAQMVMVFLAGFALAYLGVARSLDVVGHRRLGIVALIPYVNILFGFFPSAKSANPVKRSKLDDMQGPIGTTLAVFLALIAIGAVRTTNETAQEHAAAYSADPNRPLIELKIGIATHGLNAMLHESAKVARDQLPIRLDEQTVLRAVSADAHIMTSHYTVENSRWAPDTVFTAEIHNHNCQTPAARVLLDAGAEIRSVYTLVSGETIGEISSQSRNC